VITPARLSIFAVLLIAVFAGAAAIGAAIDPSRSDAGDSHGDDGSAAAAELGAGHGAGAQTAQAVLPGLAVAQDGYRLALRRRTYERSVRVQRVDFQIVDERGRPVRDFEVAHEKRMHFIVVRRDFEDFQHLHPRLRNDGTWTVSVRFAHGGSYRAFADFRRDGEQRTLGADVQVSGASPAAPLPAPQRMVRSDGGLEVTLRSDAGLGAERRVAFEVRDRGAVVNDQLEAYLGAKGHLVTLREGDLAYLHTHPDANELAFQTAYPSAGAYRLFVQFSYKGRIHTAAFTQEVPE
jgi:hypothetical protein